MTTHIVICYHDYSLSQISTIPGRSRLIVAIAKQAQVIMPVVLQGDLKYLSHVKQQEQGPGQSMGKRPYGK